MRVTTYEATVEDGQIRLSEPVRLPEHATVYVVVPDAGEEPRVRAGSPRLAEPARAGDFVMDVVEDSPDAGLR